jgi:hypothetical protein
MARGGFCLACRTRTGLVTAYYWGLAHTLQPGNFPVCLLSTSIPAWSQLEPAPDLSPSINPVALSLSLLLAICPSVHYRAAFGAERAAIARSAFC